MKENLGFEVMLALIIGAGCGFMILRFILEFNL